VRGKKENKGKIKWGETDDTGRDDLSSGDKVNGRERELKERPTSAIFKGS